MPTSLPWRAGRRLSDAHQEPSGPGDQVLVPPVCHHGEREKRRQLAPLYQMARRLLHGLGVSQQNLLYFASLVNFYTIHDLRNIKKEQTWLYRMCYIWLRYLQLSHNLTSAMMWHIKQTEDRCNEEAKKNFEADVLQRQQENNKVGRLLSRFVDDTMPFGDVRQRA